MQDLEAGEIDVGVIHDVDGSGLRQEQVEGMDVVQLAVRDVDEARNAAPQIEQGVHLDCPLGGAEVRPREDLEHRLENMYRRGGVKLHQGLRR